MNRSIKAYQALVTLCQNPEIKDNAREVNEMLGFISAIAASPEPLDLQQWFPYLWTQGEPLFSHEALAVDFAGAALQFYEACLVNYQQAKPLLLATELWLDEYQEVTEQGIAFASGYLSGFHNTEESWQTLNLTPGSEPEQLLQTSMLLLSKMATPNSNDPQMQALFVQLPGMQEIVSSLPLLLSALGHFSIVVDDNE